LDYIQFNMVSTEDYFRNVMETALWVLVKWISSNHSHYIEEYLLEINIEILTRVVFANKAKIHTLFVINLGIIVTCAKE